MNIEKDITFKELRGYLSIIDRLSICMLETLEYENFICIGDVPDTYDKYYIYGIGMIQSEFYEMNGSIYAACGELQDLVYLDCLEIMLSKEPKSVLVKRENEKCKTEKENE